MIVFTVIVTWNWNLKRLTCIMLNDLTLFVLCLLIVFVFVCARLRALDYGSWWLLLECIGANITTTDDSTLFWTLQIQQMKQCMSSAQDVPPYYVQIFCSDWHFTKLINKNSLWSFRIYCKMKLKLATIDLHHVQRSNLVLCWLFMMKSSSRKYQRIARRDQLWVRELTDNGT